MIQKLTPQQIWTPSVERSRSLEELLQPWGQYGLEHVRHGEVIGFIPFPNGITNVGKNYMLDAAFSGSAQLSTWYLGLINATAGTPTLAAADTAASHAGWVEFTTYTETTRQAWAKNVAAASQQITGTAASAFTIGSVADGTLVGGGFLISNNTKSGTTGTLWSTGLVANPVPVQATDVFRLGYATGL